MEMKLFDIGEISKREITDEGYLLVSAKVAKVGIQEYGSYEFGDDAPSAAKDRGVVRLLRPEEAVSAADSLATVENKPITDGHPRDFVDATNVRDLQRGFSKPGVEYRDGFVLADLVIQDADLIKRIQQGKDQVSLGYTADIKWDGGDSPYGIHDGIQTNIKVNHIAIVDQGRAGPEVRLDDQKTGDDMAEEKAILDAQKELMDGLKKEVAEYKTKLEDSVKEVEKLRGELDAAKARIETELNDGALDKRVNDRIALVDRARKLHADLDPAGKSDTEIKCLAILHVNDAVDVEGKSNEYIDGMFEAMAASAKDTDAVVKDLQDACGEKKHEDARDKFVKRSREAYKGDK
jgi:hypothetical protein